MAPVERNLSLSLGSITKKNYSSIIYTFSEQVGIGTATRNNSALNVLSRYNYPSNIGIFATSILPTKNCYKNNNVECKFLNCNCNNELSKNYNSCQENNCCTCNQT